MNALRHADAQVAAATHPRGNMRWRMQRYNPLARLRWQKNRVAHPVAHQRARTRARMNYINPLFYLRRIKYNLSGVGRRRHTTHVI
ncbi:hypothetical protein KC19_8G077200 [Ceratodon purpureus]|uniref:Uncharacterized protein n=1 Tax=Ceratodon purpureus TaxID=3225 RepID=A0A8T0H0V8_CERPU|nr:hypothetical protein KC19_8G077200 [Ceratodon purpureus]